MLWIMGDAVDVESVETIFDGRMLYDYGHSLLPPFLALALARSPLFSVPLHAHTITHIHTHRLTLILLHFIAAIPYLYYIILCVW